MKRKRSKQENVRANFWRQALLLCLHTILGNFIEFQIMCMSGQSLCDNPCLSSTLASPKNIFTHLLDFLTNFRANYLKYLLLYLLTLIPYIRIISHSQWGGAVGQYTKASARKSRDKTGGKTPAQGFCACKSFHTEALNFLRKLLRNLHWKFLDLFLTSQIVLAV